MLNLPFSGSPENELTRPELSAWPASPERPSRADLIWFPLLILLAIVAAVRWTPYSLFRVDNLSFYLPWYEHLGQRLRDFDIPGWLPNTMSGVPFAGDPESGWGYLPAMIIMTLMPSLVGFKIYLGFHVVLAAAGSYIYLRNIRMRAVAAFAGGAVFTLGNFMERTSCCMIHMQVAVWIPIVFFLIDRALSATTPLRRRTYLLMAGLGISQIIAGWVGQGAYYGCLTVGLYFVYRWFGQSDWRTRRGLLRLIEAVAILLIVTGSMVATVILPRLDVVGRSNLADLYDDSAGAPSQSGWHFMLLVERVLGPMVRVGRWYLGIPGLVLMVVAPILLWRRKDVLFFACFSLGVLAMIVEHSPVTWLFDLLPRFASLHSHSPDRVFIVFFIGPAILSAAVIDALVDPRWRLPSPFRIGLAVELPVVLIVAVLIAIQEQSHYWIPTSRIVFVVLVCLGVGLGLSRRPWLKQLGVAMVLIVILADPTGRLLVQRFRQSSDRAAAESLVEANTSSTGASQWLQAKAETEPPFRFFGYDLAAMTLPGERATYVIGHYRPDTAGLLVNNRGIRLGLEDVQGYNPVQVKRYVAYFTALNGTDQSYHLASVLEGGLASPLLNLLNVRYIVIPAVLPPDRPDLLLLSARYPTVYSDSQNRILENETVVPRVWIVHEAIKTNTGNILPQLVSGTVDPRETALLDTNAPILVPNPDLSAEQTEIVSRSDDEIHVRVTVGTRGMVMLSEVWDPGWTATVDGQRARVYRSDYLFRGILVDSGTHDIVLRYPARLVKMTLLLWLLPFAALPSLLAADWVTARRSNRRTQTSELGPPFVSDEVQEQSDFGQSATIAP